MAKEPLVGSIKTRLSPPLSPEEAAEFYEAMLLDTINMASSVMNVDLGIAVTPPESTGYFKHLAPRDTILIPVECADIGECLAAVLGKLFSMSYDHVLAINSDGPSTPSVYIERAVQSLEKHDLVLGPAEDGGYYLVGLNQVHAEIFTGIDWSTNQVLNQTLTKATQTGLTIDLLPAWYDVDTAADIDRLRQELETLPPGSLKFTRKFFKRWPGIM